MGYIKTQEITDLLNDWDAAGRPLSREVLLGSAFGNRVSSHSLAALRRRLESVYAAWETAGPKVVFTSGRPVTAEDAVDIHEDEAEEEPVVSGTMTAPDQRRQPSRNGVVQTYVFTCAQNNTNLVPDNMWNTLLKLVDYYDAELHVSRYTYNKAAYGRNSVKPGSKKAGDGDDLWYDVRIEPYVSDDDIQITDDLVWLGSLNMSPTLVNPISGFQTHTRQASAIMPHNKMQLESVANMQDERTRMMYTTGCITQRNYIQKSAGQKADFHHVFGAVLVEVNENGDWWARQLNFDKDGGLYDLDKFFTETEVFEQVRAQALTHGDIHGHKLDIAVCETVFGPNGMMDVLMPREQFFHDIIDFMPRNHHNIKNFQFMNQMHEDGYARVQDEFNKMARWLMNDAYRDWCKSFVVVSNHDQAVELWLDNRAGLDDPVNLDTWLHMNLRRVRNHDLHPFIDMLSSACLREVQPSVGGWLDDRCTPMFLSEKDSYKILGMIEAALHGHKGPNGSRGSPKNLKAVGKANTGHTHTAGIYEGVYTAGVLGKLDMDYNVGPSSWSHSSIVTYANGKRSILTQRAGKWWR